jgi:Ca2+/Na+ antiporter
MNTFKTRSTSAKIVRTTVFTFLLMFALAFLGLRVAVATWLFLEGVLLLCFLFCLVLTSRNHWEIRFEDDKVLVYHHGSKQSYIFEDLKQSDFHIQQSEKQKAKNACDMRLEDAVFRFYDVQSCKEMQAYIRQHFPV